MRFYDIDKGEILIDGIDIKMMDKEYLRSRISLVHQENFLFSGSIKDNIFMGSKEITNKELMGIASQINANEFILKLPKKFDHEILERGANLSAGEKQLLAFARALAHNGDIFILDEATSNIDTHTELLIQDTIKKLTKMRTSLIIAHRLSTILHADRIIVLSKGEIKEIGTHNELIQKKGYYSRLYRLQYQEQLN
jgi:ATP-binding cassette subfamily B protein